jgi:hypothetical protein
MLRACLDSLVAQVPPEGWVVTLIVVENDDGPRCFDIVAEVKKMCALSSRIRKREGAWYPVRPKRGDRSIAGVGRGMDRLYRR